MSRTYAEVIGPIEDRMIRAVWRVTRHPQDAEDAMQDALAKVLKTWDRVIVHPNPQALVLKICIDAAYDLIRKRSRAAGRQEDVAMDAISDSSSDPLEKLSGDETVVRILSAIANLPKQQAVAAVLRLHEQLPYSVIGTTLGCSEGTARTHVTRARQQLSTTLRDLLPCR